MFLLVLTRLYPPFPLRPSVLFQCLLSFPELPKGHMSAGLPKGALVSADPCLTTLTLTRPSSVRTMAGLWWLSCLILLQATSGGWITAEIHPPCFCVLVCSCDTRHNNLQTIELRGLTKVEIWPEGRGRTDTCYFKEAGGKVAAKQSHYRCCTSVTVIILCWISILKIL